VAAGGAWGSAWPAKSWTSRRQQEAHNVIGVPQVLDRDGTPARARRDCRVPGLRPGRVQHRTDGRRRRWPGVGAERPMVSQASGATTSARPRDICCACPVGSLAETKTLSTGPQPAEASTDQPVREVAPYRSAGRHGTTTASRHELDTCLKPPGGNARADIAGHSKWPARGRLRRHLERATRLSSADAPDAEGTRPEGGETRRGVAECVARLVRRSCSAVD